MKKLVLLFTGLLMTLTTVTAAEKIDTAKQGEDLKISTRYTYVEPIQFVERGVEFLIFPDGSFDFNTDLDYTQGDGYYRQTTSRRSTINTTYGAPGTQVRYSTPRDRGVIVTHDRDGKVRRIGNVFVNYNRYGQVKRLGSVYINYTRNGMLTQVGGLQLRYDRQGRLIQITGQVNYSNPRSQVTVYNGHSQNNNQYDNDWNTNTNDDYYYYKSGETTKKVKKLKLDIK